MSPLPEGARWSDAALTLFEAEGEIAVSAAAGAGKTTALVELLRRRLAGAGPGPALAPREVVAITFTERAGAELVARLGRELADGVRSLREAGTEEGAARLEAALRDLPSLAVGTIHGWAAGLLRQHALEAGIDPDFAVLDEEEAGELLAAASLGAAVEALDGGSADALRLAAALGGAQAVADAAASLVRERATRGLSGDPGWVEGDPAAVDAARTALLDASAELAGMAGQATTATGREALARLARAREEVLAGERAVDPVAEADRLGRLAAALKGWRTGKRDPAALLEARARLIDSAGRLGPLAAELAAAPLAGALAGVVAGAARRYAAAKARAGGLDFDDLLAGARNLLRGSPALAGDLRSRVRALLVDEYQDVNGLQAELFDLLAPPLRVAVGDAKQSIYRFRGADVAVFAGLIRRLEAGPGRVVHLRENHRSVPGVVDLVNAVFAAGGGVLGVPFGPEDRLLSMREEGDRPATELLEDAPGAAEAGSEERRLLEARAVAARVAELVAAGRRPAEVALLFRRLTHVAVFERALREAGLPVRVARGGGFFQAPEVRDLGELCASVEEPGDEVAWAALLRSPLCALSDGSLVALARGGLSRLARLPPASAEEVLLAARGGAPAPDGEAHRLRRFLDTWRSLRSSRRRLDAAEMLEHAAERLDLEAALLAGPDGERRAGNLRKALALVRRLADRGATPADVAARLRRLALAPPREPEADAGDADAVSLLTVHQAKGLEWPVVVLPDLAARPPSSPRRPVLDERGRVAVPLPGAGGDGSEETATTARLRAAAAAAEAAESQRLLYVALTRARDRLVLSGAGGRPPTGSWAEAVLQAPPDLLERRSAPSWPPPATAPRVAEAGEPVAPRLRAAPPAPTLRFPVTGLAEYARCPRRHWMGTQMRLPEPRTERGGERRAGDDPDRATFRGTLAHALLAEVDLGAEDGAARRESLEAAAERRGEDPRRPAVREIVDEVEGFLASSDGAFLRGAAADGSLRREIPFVIRVGGEHEEGVAPAEAGAGGPEAGAVYLDGTIDALVVGPDEVQVLDYKFARHHPGAEDRYRFQLAAYALAAQRAFPGRPVRALLHYLRGDGRTVDVTPGPDGLDRLARELPALARAAARGEGRDLSPSELGRDRARCESEGCGFVARCFGGPAPDPA
ncbi:MAG TPA: UvrD-helicase domain-containing protein [Anaeromyxobacteraceae bacterium]|nr:UvrD-helicase domain-containing protein [Anaeromyxobacteraceae bacterium]